MNALSRFRNACLFIILFVSGTKKEPKPKLFESGYLCGGVGVFHVNGWGPKSSVCPSKPRESNFFGGISWDFAGKKRSENAGANENVSGVCVCGALC